MNTRSALFISHGSPTLALEPGRTGDALAALGRTLPRPRALVIASAHWVSREPLVSATARPETIYDFAGFPEPLYRIRYAAPGAPEVAARVHELLASAGFRASLDARRGLDHGAWVPLSLMYPAADIPTLQVSIQPALGPAHHYRLGQALAPLAEENVLVIGSGSLTHNLPEIRWHADDAPEWVESFREWIRQTLGSGDVDALLDYRARAPHAVRNHPTDEHLLPLFVAAGAGGGLETARRVNDEVTHGVLGMDAYLFGDAQHGAGRA